MNNRAEWLKSSNLEVSKSEFEAQGSGKPIPNPELLATNSSYFCHPEYYQCEKYYKMGPFCNPLLYNESGEGRFMFYDANFSNVAGIDILGNELYSNEYGPNGEILYSINYSNIYFGCNLYDEDFGSYLEKATGASSPFGSLSYSLSKDLPTFKNIAIIVKATAKSSGPPTDWIWIWLPAGAWDCFGENGEIYCYPWDWNDDGEENFGWADYEPDNEICEMYDCDIRCDHLAGDPKQPNVVDCETCYECCACCNAPNSPARSSCMDKCLASDYCNGEEPLSPNIIMQILSYARII